MELEERICSFKGCSIRFRCLPISKQTGCSKAHDPVGQTVKVHGYHPLARGPLYRANKRRAQRIHHRETEARLNEFSAEPSLSCDLAVE